MDSVDNGTAQANESPSPLGYRARSSLLLMYSHWEGFAKSSFKLYYNEITAENCSSTELNDGLLGLSVQKSFRNAIAERSPLAAGRLAHRAIRGDNCLMMPSVDKVIATKSNLSVSRTRELLSRFGLDRSSLQQWEQTTIKPLVDQRNAIAHGAGLEIDEARYKELHHSVIDLLDALRDLIESAAERKAHLRNPT